MNCARKFVGLVSVFILIVLLTFVQRSAAGSRQDQLAHFGIGARALALNSAYTAVANDYTAPFWNPSAMDFFSTTKLGGMWTHMSLNRTLTYAGVIVPTHRWGAFAVAWAGLGVKEIEARTNNTREPDRLFNYNENTFYLSYAYRLLPFLSIGITGKFFNFQTLDATANGTGVDVGLLFAPSRKVRFGLVAQDLRSELKWSSATHEKFIPNYRLGLAIEPFSNLLVATDYHRTNEGASRLSFASEIIALNVLKIRCGIGESRFTAGLGVTFQAKGLFLNLNYAIATDHFDLGVSDGFDMSLVF